MRREIFDTSKHIKTDIWPRAEIQRQIDAMGTSPDTRIDKCVLVLEHDEHLAGVYLDTMAGREVLPSAPWRGAEHRNSFWTDDDSKLFAKYCSETYRFRPSVGAVDEALRSVTYDARAGRMVSPWRAYLEDRRGTWDGQCRFDDLPHRILGIPKGAYSRAVHQCWLIGAVKRAFEPGEKVDAVLTYYGPQGTGKSSFLALLPPDDGLYADLDFSRFSRAKDVGEDLQGKAIIELGEMRGLRKVSQGDAKSGLTRQKDTYRDAYGKRSEDHLRGCVFACTVNPKDDCGFLTDTTGNRRYLPVEVPGCGRTYDQIKDIMDAERDQIWAEAVMYYDMGAKPILSPEIEAQAEALRQELLDVDHDMADSIKDYLAMPLSCVQRQWYESKDLSAMRTEWRNWRRMDDQTRQKLLPAADKLDGQKRYPREWSCVSEIWQVALGNDKEPDRRDAQQITQLFAAGQIAGWTYDRKGCKVCGDWGRKPPIIQA